MNTKNISIGIVVIVVLIAIGLYSRKTNNTSTESATVPNSDVTSTTTPTSTSTTPTATTTKPITPVKPVPPSTTKADDSKATYDSVRALVDANNTFALNMYIKLATAEPNKNVFFSPYSISSALSMLYEGARSTTSAEIARVLNLSGDETLRRASNARIYNDLNTTNKAFTLKTANALWTEKTYELLPNYLNTVSTYYKGKATGLDFAHNTEPSRVTINTWVENQTNSKIKDLIPKYAVDAFTRLIITNAIYFKGNWALQFDKSKTAKADFHVSTTTTALVDMMSIADGKKWNYAESDAGKMLELPYAGDQLSMIIVLQKGASMQASQVADLQDALAQQKVNVYIPRFKMETQYSLKDHLSALGMPTAFSLNADFSNMSARDGLYVSSVVHKAFIEVNEEGTEAAAATGVIVSTTSATAPVPIPEFRADHPFLFMIRDMKTDEIIFMGKVVNPNQ